MKKTFIILGIISSLIFLSTELKAQIFAGNDSTICGGDSITLNATMQPLYFTNLYQFQVVPYAPEVYGGTPIPTPSIGGWDDGVTQEIQFSFDFCFFGNVYSSCWIGTNGWITFQPPLASYTTYTSAPIPSTNMNVPKNCIMAPWEDWHPGVGVGPYVFYYETGTAPNRKFVVNWNNCPMFSCTTTYGKFQIVICEFTNEIYNHLTNKPTCFTWANGTGTQGVHNFNGTIAYTAPGRNSTQWQAINESTRFIPGDLIPPSAIEWYDMNGNVIGTGPTITVLPTQTECYVASVTSCSGALFGDTVCYIMDTGEIEVLTDSAYSQLNVPCNGGNTGYASLYINGGTPPYTFNWSNGQVQTTTDTIATLQNLTAGYYFCTVTWGGGCFATKSFAITENPPMSIVSSSEPETCPGAEDGKVSIQLTNGIQPITYNIVGVGISPPQNSNSYTFSGISTGNYNIIVTDAYGCQTTGSIFVDQLELDIAANNSVIKCYGDTNGFASIQVVGGTPPYSYQWSNGYTTPGITNLGAGTYSVTATDAKGCTIDTAVSFTTPDPLQLYTSGDQTICLSQPANLVSQVIGGTVPYTYQWTNGLTTANVTVEPSVSETYCVTAIDSNGCVSNTRCITVNVNPALRFLNAEIVDDTICLGDTTSILAEITGGNGGPYFYEIYNGPAINPPFEVSPTVSREYIIIGRDGCGTPAVRDTIAIDVLEAPPVMFTSSTIKGCEPLNVSFFNETEEQIIAAYEWDFNDGEFFNYSTLRNPNHRFVNPGTYDVKLKVTTNAGCVREFTAEEMIKVFPKPEARFIANPEVVSITEPIIQFENLSLDDNRVFWSFGDGDSVLVDNITHRYDEVGEFLVTLIAENDHENTVYCRDTAYLIVKVEEFSTLYTPNAFNPYSPISENKIFAPLGIGVQAESYIFSIYSRWGEKVFETDNPYVGWDGSNNGDGMCETGTYSWFIKYVNLSGVRQSKAGHVTLLK